MFDIVVGPRRLFCEGLRGLEVKSMGGLII